MSSPCGARAGLWGYMKQGIPAQVLGGGLERQRTSRPQGEGRRLVSAARTALIDLPSLPSPPPGSGTLQPTPDHTANLLRLRHHAQSQGEEVSQHTYCMPGTVGRARAGEGTSSRRDPERPWQALHTHSPPSACLTTFRGHRGSSWPPPRSQLCFRIPIP